MKEILELYDFKDLIKMRRKDREYIIGKDVPLYVGEYGVILGRYDLYRGGYRPMYFYNPNKFNEGTRI